MKMQFFTIPIRDPEPTTDDMNAFLASHRVVHTERQFVADGANSVWSICVSYVEGEGRPAADKRNKKVDYREVLSEAEFSLFAKLRTLRKELAEHEGVPVYALFTNEQLADMVRQRVDALPGLASIDGVGKARVDKYGAAFVRLLEEHIPALLNGAAEAQSHETDSDSA
jgi:superfamily II DNA helicase RecQ